MKNWTCVFAATLALGLLMPTLVLAQFVDSGQVNNEYPRNAAEIGFWASTIVDYHQGYQDYQQPELGYATYGSQDDILGSMGTAFSLGDGGHVTVSFEQEIMNGPGDDFVVFENGFEWQGVYMELGFVEVSSNGIDFSRLPALCRLTTQPGPWESSDPTDFYNLAGNFVGGTGFDLQDLITAGDASVSSGLVDIGRITFVRIVDVVGDVSDGGATQDYLGNAVADPYPTASESCGMDITGVAGIHGGTVATEQVSWGNVKSLYR